MTSYHSRSKGFGEIARDAERILGEIGQLDENGRTVISSEALELMLAEVDDPGHFEEPLAMAIYALLRRRGGRVVLRPPESLDKN